MNKRERDGRVQRSLFSWQSYAFVLFAFAAVVAITFALLFQGSDAYDALPLGRRVFAIANFLGVSAMATVLWGLWRRATTQRPVERILDFTGRVAEGDFAARIPERQGIARNEFDVISVDLNRMAAELASVETLRTDFVASVSHEMKTPLSVISNYTTILQDSALSDSERTEAAAKCGEAARRLSKMVGDILRLNKLENQVIAPGAKSLDLSELLAECVLSFDDVLEQRGLELSCGIQPGVWVRGDADLLALVWNNLLSNACKFTPAGGRVSVTLRADGFDAVVEVSDNGCGMTEDEARRAFDKFYQTDGSHAAEGNGLGLALAKKVCDLHGASIAVESAPGEGSTFIVELPRDGANGM